MFHVKHASGSRSTRPSSGAGSGAPIWSRGLVARPLDPALPRFGAARPPARRRCGWPHRRRRQRRGFPRHGARDPRRRIAASPWSRPTASAAPSCARWPTPPAPGLRDRGPARGARPFRPRCARRHHRRPRLRAAGRIARSCFPRAGTPIHIVYSRRDAAIGASWTRPATGGNFRADIVPSQTAAEARILRISDVERRRRS